jgi:hypothetical protein
LSVPYVTAEKFPWISNPDGKKHVAIARAEPCGSPPASIAAKRWQTRLSIAARTARDMHRIKLRVDHSTISQLTARHAAEV